MNRIALPHGPRALAHQAGVTLIELMIGMLIGMLAILVISQVMLVSEGQKRTTTGGADAQVNGALSLYAIQRDIQIAGYGFSSNPEILGCQIRAQFAGALLPGVSGRLSPLVITPESPRVAGGAGDAIRVFASSKTSYAVPARVIKPGLNANGQSVPVSSALGFSQGDLMLVARDDVLPCWLFQVTAVPTAKDVPRADNPASWNAAGQPTQLYDDGSFLASTARKIIIAPKPAIMKCVTHNV